MSVTSKDELAVGNEVKFTGSGKFTAVARPARVTVAAKTAPKFSSGAQLKKALDG